MPTVPLYGHAALRRRLGESAERGALPASLLLHGPRGTGKQRLALWLGQLLLCTREAPHPCGRCQSCRYALRLVHPDLHWFFPRPRLKEADATPDEVRADYAEAIDDRAQREGLYAPPSGSDALFVSTVRAIVAQAALSPALGRRKIFIIGDAERMVPQEGAEAAANAFLKLLEEPPANTTLILTSSEPGALLPTIRSRVVAVRVAPLSDDDVRAFLADATVAAALGAEAAGGGDVDLVRLAAGSPGALLGGGERADALAGARRILEAAEGGRVVRARLALAQGGARARGAFADALDSLTVLLRERARDALSRHDARGAYAAARAVEYVERAKSRADGNVSPQLITAALVRDLAETLR